MSSSRAYLDYNATAPLRPEARAAMLAALDLTGNASSVHTEGRRARAVIEAGRAEVAALAGARVSDVVFTSGATEAANWVMTRPWRRIVVSAIEHPCVLEAARRSCADVDVLAVKPDGAADVDELARLLAGYGNGDGEILVAVQHANNETGIVQPVADVVAIARDYGARVLIDAVQTAGRIALNFDARGADFMLLSSHKIGGPKGVGALVVSEDARLPAMIVGGGQEKGRRAGTENVEAIVGFGAAAAAARRDLDRAGEIETLRDALEAGLARVTPDVRIIGQGVSRLANTCLAGLAGGKAETIVIALDLNGVAASAGAACSSGTTKRSAVLDAMGVDDDVAQGMVRFSLGWASREEDVAACVSAWQRVNKVRGRERQVA
ncbi:MAG: cysteine desulfurase [Hyphomicrobiaceae bacterium]|nr:cysteine desulfurase [Hyphomicrobiaceae bacterium]